MQTKTADQIRGLKGALRNHLQARDPMGTLSDLGIYSCHRPQRLRAVPIYQPTLLLVICGRKELSTGDLEFSVTPGQAMIVPAQTTFMVENHPDGDGNDYLGMALRFSPEALDQFRSQFGPDMDQWDLAPRWQTPAPADILGIMRQWLDWGRDFTMNPAQARHRQVELLFLLARAGLAGNLLLADHPSYRERVRQYLTLDPARPWQMQDLCAQLGISESGLRRHLQEEETSFRDILEEVRMANGLNMLWETLLPIARIAEASGYQSQSRFTERFKNRFGMTPSELRQTLPAARNQALQTAAV